LPLVPVKAVLCICLVRRKEPTYANRWVQKNRQESKRHFDIL